MITLYGFGSIFPEGIGHTKDLWAQWALEESGLPYRVHALDHGAGDLDSEAYSRISPFHQVPVIEDDGFAVAESAAVVLYVAEKSGKLLPKDERGRVQVMQWSFAAVGTVLPTFLCMDVIEIFDTDKTATKLRAEVPKLGARWLGHLERRLAERAWIATDDFSAADLMMASVLRAAHSTWLEPHPKVQAYKARCHARPAWQRTLQLYAERLGVSVDAIR